MSGPKASVCSPFCAPTWRRERAARSIGADGRVARPTGYGASVAYASERDGRLVVDT